jgi:hypothetical protein
MNLSLSGTTTETDVFDWASQYSIQKLMTQTDDIDVKCGFLQLNFQDSPTFSNTFLF